VISWASARQSNLHLLDGATWALRDVAGQGEGDRSIEANFVEVEFLRILLPIPGDQDIESMQDDIVDFGSTRGDMERVSLPRQASHCAFEQDPIQAGETGLAIVPVARPHEVHDALGAHVIGVRLIRDLAPLEEVFARQSLQREELRLDVGWALVERSVEFSLSKRRRQNGLFRLKDSDTLNLREGCSFGNRSLVGRTFGPTCQYRLLLGGHSARPLGHAPSFPIIKRS
jgi:hypothetical protein